MISTGGSIFWALALKQVKCATCPLDLAFMNSLNFFFQKQICLVTLSLFRNRLRCADAVSFFMFFLLSIHLKTWIRLTRIFLVSSFWLIPFSYLLIAELKLPTTCFIWRLTSSREPVCSLLWFDERLLKMTFWCSLNVK